MSKTNSLTRRTFLQLSAGVTVASLFPQIAWAAPTRQDSTFVPDVELLLRAKVAGHPIFPGTETRVWRYEGEVVKGDTANLVPIDGSFLGPSIHVRTGQNVRIRFQNELPEASNIHWHGLHVPDSADGHPRFLAEPGGEYIYEFEVKNRAGMYWYHPHPHKRTGAHVNSGLAGLLFVHDDEEDQANLPGEDYEIPLVIQDRRVDDNNQFAYVQSNHDRMMGFSGNVVLLNGKAEYEFPVEARPYRLRLMNGSNSRIYFLRFDQDVPFSIIGTDGGLLEQPVNRDFIILPPAKRVDVWVDFSQVEAGNTVSLLHASSNGQVQLATFPVEATQQPVNAELPTLNPIVWHDPAGAVNLDTPRTFAFTMLGMNTTINGRTFEMEEVADDETVQLGDLEVWEFYNDPRGGMMMTAHPVHVHGLQFQIMERQLDAAYDDGSYDTIINNYVDEGWHDTVLILPGERVKVLLKFEDYPGLFLYHCHTLEHEDNGMMRNYRVVDNQV